MKFIRNLLCRIGFHDFIINYSENSRVCKNCYIKFYKRKNYIMKRKATKQDIREIKISKLSKT